MKTELFLHIIYLSCQRHSKNQQREYLRKIMNMFLAVGGGGGAHRYIGYISICATVKGRVSLNALKVKKV